MTDIVKGKSALWPADVERPVWLRDEEWNKLSAHCEGVGWQHYCNATDPVMENWQWHRLTAIRLSPTHPATIAEAWNQANPNERPFNRVWYGGSEAPSDWDEGDVLYRMGDSVSGEGLCAPSWGHDLIDGGDMPDADIVAYRSKPQSATLPTYDPATHVLVERMSEGEWEALRPGRLMDDWARSASIIRTPTKAEALAAKHGVSVEVVEDILSAE